MRSDDGVLRSLVMAHGAKELEAKGMIDRFVFEIRHAVNTTGKYRVEGLGSFNADQNNTISFTYEHRQQVFGGNIKPPITTFEQRKIQALGISPTALPNPRHSKAHPARRVGAEPTAEDSMSLGKPDDYLRGLKYDNKKNKKREDSGRSTNRAGRATVWLTTILIMAIIAGAATLVWMQKMTPIPVATDIDELPYFDDSILMEEPIVDTLMVDDQGIADDSLTTQITTNE